MDAEERTLDLVRQAVAGGAAALKLLLTESHARYCEYLARRIPPEYRTITSAEDILQETYVQVFTHIGGFQPTGPRSFDRWVMTIALRRLRNALKRERTIRRGGGRRAVAIAGSVDDSMIGLLDLIASPVRSPSRTLARREAVEAMQAALSRLPDHYRKALWLVYIQGFTAADAADEMGNTERAVHGLCRRGLKMLREQMGSASAFLSSSD